ncbi:MAG: hypothetical protein LBO20_03365, partial [Bifidobacteriaceae bacterium]|nr:hypothetical protein [Bifidobacteriaceae bacterium]
GGGFQSPLAAQRLGPAMAIAGSLAEPELLTRAICYLADYDAARHINGVIVPVDGGWSVM